MRSHDHPHNQHEGPQQEAPEQRERLFTRFFQAAERPAGGLGLGLYVCRRIVELHGGLIWAEFPDDGGSRFVVELPRGVA